MLLSSYGRCDSTNAALLPLAASSPLAQHRIPAVDPLPPPANDDHEFFVVDEALAQRCGPISHMGDEARNARVRGHHLALKRGGLSRSALQELRREVEARRKGGPPTATRMTLN